MVPKHLYLRAWRWLDNVIVNTGNANAKLENNLYRDEWSVLENTLVNNNPTSTIHLQQVLVEEANNDPPNCHREKTWLNKKLKIVFTECCMVHAIIRSCANWMGE